MKRNVLVAAGIAVVLFFLWLGRSAILTDPNRGTPSPTPDTFERKIIIPPQRRTIQKITAETITIADDEGASLLSNDPNIVKVYIEQNGQRTVSSLDTLQVGQAVTVILVQPGEEIHLITQ